MTKDETASHDERTRAVREEGLYRANDDSYAVRPGMTAPLSLIFIGRPAKFFVPTLSPPGIRVRGRLPGRRCEECPAVRTSLCGG